ncbi:DUF4012 domain-containing protein [bacterium]|jgi:hypothetical protein|nr:DUF4012 domain-containing protein [bacterium]MBT6293357.1 DUF4012 domain-containing protein [bacterium]
MNKYIFKFFLPITILILFSLFKNNAVLLQSNTLKEDLISGDFKQIQTNIDDLLQKASFIHPVFNDYQFKIKDDLSQILNNWENFLVFTTKNKLVLQTQSILKINPIYISFLSEFSNDIQNFNKNIKEIQKLILNPKYRFQENYLINSKLSETLDKLNSKIYNIEDHLKLIQSLIGINRKNNILVLLQNDYESRATGGFISALLDIEIFKGEVQKLDIKDVYDFDGQLVPEIDSPLEFKDINSKLFIRDSNFDPDFNKSALLVDKQIQSAISKSYDYIAGVNLSFLNEMIVEPIELKYQYTYLNKLKLKENINDHISILMNQVLKSPNFLRKSFDTRDLQITSKDPNLDKLLKEYNFYHSTNPNITTVSKANVNGYKSFFSQKSKLQMIIDHSNKKVKKSIKISSSHPYSNENQIYLESIFKQLGLKNKHDLFSGLKKNIQNFYRIYLPDLNADNTTKAEYILLEENLIPFQESSNLEYTYFPQKKQFDFNEQVEVIGYKHFEDVQLIVVLPKDKTLFSPLFEYTQIKENTYEIPFDSEFIVINK